MDKEKIRAYFSALVQEGKPFWGVGVSKPNDFRKAVDAGAAWLVASHAGGLDPNVPASAIGLLPYADANSDALELAGLTESSTVPVVAGIFASDQFRIMGKFLEDVKTAGFGAVQNFPSVGIAEGRFKAFLFEAGMGYNLEIELIRMAAAMDFFTSAVVFTREQAEEMLKAGADMLLFHPGLTADGEFRHWNNAARQRFAEILDAIPAGGKGIVLARVAFEPEDNQAEGAECEVGVQYDRNI